MKPTHQSLLSDFLSGATDHLRRLRETGSPEVLVDQGQAVGVVMSPEAFRLISSQARLVEDGQAILTAHDQYLAEDFLSAEASLDEVRLRLNQSKPRS